jgi:ribosomal protein S18 acetylase RimI-like enzyme
LNAVQRPSRRIGGDVFSWHKGTAADLEPFIGLWSAKAALGRYYPVPEADYLRKRMQTLDVLDRAGQLAGVRGTRPYETADGRVWRVELFADGPEAMKALLENSVESAWRDKASIIQQWGDADPAELGKLGFTRVKTFIAMHRSTLSNLPNFKMPTSFRFVDFAAQVFREQDWLAVMNEAFAGTWRAARIVDGDVTRRYEDAGHSRDLDLMAVSDDGTPAAVVLSGLQRYQDQRAQPVAAVEVVATRPRYRRQGVATNLMGIAMRRLARRAGNAEVEVDSSNSSREIYERLGFTPAISIDVWELERRREP